MELRIAFLTTTSPNLRRCFTGNTALAVSPFLEEDGAREQTLASSTALPSPVGDRIHNARAWQCYQQNCENEMAVRSDRARSTRPIGVYQYKTEAQYRLGRRASGNSC